MTKLTKETLRDAIEAAISRPFLDYLRGHVEPTMVIECPRGQQGQQLDLPKGGVHE